MKNNLSFSPRPNFEIYRDNFYQKLLNLNEELDLKMSEKTILKHLKFIEVCYYYTGHVSGIDNYLKSKNYLLHAKLGKYEDASKMFLEEVENISKGIYLIGYLFDEKMEVKRYLFGGKSTAVLKLSKKLKLVLDGILNPLPKGI